MVIKANAKLHVFVSCFYFWIMPFGVVLTAIEATNHLTAVFLIFAPLLTYLLIIYNSIPIPTENAILDVLGEPLSASRLSVVMPSKSSTDRTTDLRSSNALKVWAHRFGGIDAPENTLCALDECIKNGAKGVEFDIVLTADFVPVVFHDPKLERMTGIDEDIRTLPYSRVKEINVSVFHHFREQFPNSRIPLFEDVVQKCLEHDIRMIVDIKDERSEIVDIIVQMFKKYPAMYKKAIVSGFNPFIIYQIRKADPAIVGALAWRPYYMSYCRYSPYEEDCVPYHKTMLMYYIARVQDLVHTFFFFNFAYDLLGISAVLINKDNITVETIKYWNDRNIRVLAWTVNSPWEKQFLINELGIPYLTDTMLGKNVD